MDKLPPRPVLGEGHQKLHGIFGLTRASWALFPRAVMYEMSDEWQGKFAELMEEFNDTFAWDGDLSFHISAKDGNKFTSLPEHLCNYRYPKREEIYAVKKL